MFSITFFFFSFCNCTFPVRDGRSISSKRTTRQPRPRDEDVAVVAAIVVAVVPFSSSDETKASVPLEL